MKRNLAVMREFVKNAGMAAVKFTEFLQTWRIEVEQTLKAYEKTGTGHEKHDDMLGLMAKVEAAKQSTQKLSLKARAAEKAVGALVEK
jgi:hypothetical protein